MTHTNLYKNEIYLIVASITSVGVLSGYDYFSLAMVALLILPVIDLPNKRVFSRDRLHPDHPNKCTSCK